MENTNAISCAVSKQITSVHYHAIGYSPAANIAAKLHAIKAVAHHAGVPASRNSTVSAAPASFIHLWPVEPAHHLATSRVLAHALASTMFITHATRALVLLALF